MADHPALRLAEVHVRNFRHLAQPAELSFGEGPIVVVGKNGTGKTNLLTLLDSVATGRFHRFREDESELDVTSELVASTVRVSIRVALSVSPRSAVRSVWWDRRPDGPPDETVTSGPSENQRVHRNAEARSFAQPMEGGRLDEALSAFHSLTTGGTDENGVFGQTLTVPKVRNGWGGRWTPQGLMTTLAAQFPSDPVARSEDVPWLQDAATAAGFRSVSIHPRFSHENDAGRSYSGVAVRGALADGTVVDDRAFSFGQKRVLAFFWHLACLTEPPFGPSGVLVADELVNGIHHEAFERVMNAVHASGVQAFLASQNPLLFDHLAFDSAEAFRSRAVFCSTDARGRWVWRNPSAEESRLFFSHYEQGREHVSEILGGLGMW